MNDNFGKQIASFGCGLNPYFDDRIGFNGAHVKILAVINNGNDLTYAEIDSYLRNYGHFIISTWDGHWSRNIYIPAAPNYPERTIYVESAATYDTNVVVNGSSVIIKKGQRLKLHSDGHTWIGTWGTYQPWEGYPLHYPHGEYPLHHPHGGYPFNYPHGGYPLHYPHGGYPLNYPYF